MKLFILQKTVDPKAKEIALFMDAIYAESFKALGLPWL